MGNKGDKTRRVIVERALELFSVRGYFNTSLNDILEAARITKGGFYGHFKSKEALWFAVYDEAAAIWRQIVMRGIRDIDDPVERVRAFIMHDMRDYLGKDIFPGGCFFLNMAVELSGQSAGMAGYVRQGIDGAARMVTAWLREAERKGLLRPDLDLDEAGHFIMISLNGAAALYALDHDDRVWRRAVSQLDVYINGLLEGAQNGERALREA